jgi:SNF2 family DNA or RNA helicase
MANPKWDAQGSELWLIDPQGERLLLSADEIYAALVEKRPKHDWIPTTAEGLRASRYPLLVTLDVADGGGGCPFYEVTAALHSLKATLELSDLERGYKIVSGVWYPLDPGSLSEVLELLKTNGVELGAARSLKAFLAIRRVAEAGGAVTDGMMGQAISPLVFAPDSADVPESVRATLYAYQLSGWRWLKFLVSEEIGGLLADEMGLGKTLQIISVLSDSGAGSLQPALIVAPGSLLENWRRELVKFAPHLAVLKHHGARRTGRPADLEHYDVIVTSYETVVRDNSMLNMIAWAVIVLDEAQMIRNPQAKRTKAVKHLRRRVGIAVTGTPVENRLLDLWSIMDFILPGHLGDEQAFQEQFPDDLTGAAMLEPNVSPLMLRRRIAEVAQDLPPRIDIPQVVELDDHEAAAYEAERERINREYGQAATLVALTALRRFCAHPNLMNVVGRKSDPMDFSKFRRLDEILEEIFSLNQKVIIFTSFTAMADMIAGHIESRFGTFTGIIDGRLAIDDRQPTIDRFSQMSGGAALVLNPKAGGSGLNITAANHVIHYNPEWNPALEDQASARAYRRGQELPVTVHRLLVADTVEDVIDERLTRKRTLSETAVVGVEGNEDDYGDIVSALSRSPIGR